MRVIVSAGGTGGHIYPALGIIDKINELYPDSKILYIGTHNRMEKELIPKHHIDYEELEIYGFSKRDMKRNVKNVFLIKKAIKKCLNIMNDFKPDVVIGVGGYVTYPVISAAKKLHIPTIIHEQNMKPGKSNRALAKKVDKICVSFASSAKYFPKDKVEITGNPCGERALNIKKVSKENYGFFKNKKLVLIVAGSLGSSTMNERFKEFLLDAGHLDYEILYISGSSLYDDLIKDCKYPKNVIIKPYIDNLNSLMGDVDLMFSRSGASVLSEILSLQIPSVLIPSKYVANNEQYFNALELVNNNAAKLLLEDDITKEKVEEIINEILYNKNTISIMKDNLKKMAINDSSSRIVRIAKDLIK